SIAFLQNRFLVIGARREPLITSTILAQRLSHASAINISRFLVLRRAREDDQMSRRPMRRVPLTPGHRHQR
ncbi:hypothetical protein BDFB_011192, partial [Asbolus verrucosus]